MRRILIAIVVLPILASAAFAGNFAYVSYVQREAADAESISFVVEKDQNAGMVAYNLTEKGIIDSAFLFRQYVKFSSTGGSIKPGTFDLRKGMNFASIVSAMSQASRDEVQVTIPEGFTIKQIGERVRLALPNVTEEHWKNATGTSSVMTSDNAFFLNQVKPATVGLEGYLFPDTYRFFADATAEDVVDKMVGAMSAKLSEILPKDENGLSLPGAMTPHEVLTLASILEREVRSAAEMKDVADIFLKRMKIGMPLQADSTIAYYLGKTSAEMTLDDLKKDNPFNSYTNVGLPPGPISNPGMNAIDAVLHPTSNPYFYFLTKDDGTVVYAETFDGHIANKFRYLR